MNEYEEKSRWTEYGRALAAAVINGTELPTAEWNKNCDLNKKGNYRKSSKDSEPDTIIHINDAAINKVAVIDTLASFIKLSGDEYKLMMYYVSCLTGFKPASKVIMESTGLSKSQLCRIKNNLIEKRVIEWQGKDQWNKNCDLNKKSDRIIIDWYRLSAVAFAAELNPEQNDGHLYYRDGKRVRQNVEKKLGQENKLLWENKPASYWAFRSMKAYPCYDKADIFSGIEGMLDWKPEAKKPELWELYDSCDYEAETDLPF